MLRSKLNYKLILATISSLLLVAGIFFYFLYSYHKAQLTEGLITSTTNLSKLIQQGLEYAMVSRRGDLLKNMVYQLADGPEVSQIYILDRTGTIRVSSDEAQVGYTIDRNSHTCQLCHSKAPEKRSTTAIFRTANGSEVLRNVTPIFNKGECHGCHNPADRINGVLIMDFSMEKINAQLTQNVWTMLTMTGILVLVLAGVIGGYTNRLVFGRLKAVVKATKQVGAGDLSARVGLAGQDELAQLGQSFNQMASQLESSIDKLKTTQEYLKHLISSVDDGIVVVDRDLTVVMVNEAYLDIIGQPRENLLGSSCSNFCHQTNQPCDDTAKECTAQKTFDTGRLHKNIMTMPDDEGGERTLEIFSSPIRGADGSVDQVVEVVRDITERQRLEATLLHSEHLASLGMLAAGVAHEINNPLASIATAIEGLRRRFAERGEDWEEAAEVAEYHELIRKEVSRCKRITDKLLLLARRAPSEARWVDLKTSVEETVSLVVLEAERRGVALEWSWTDDIPPVKADDGQLRQVLLNLLLNSIQATERGGSVKVRGSKRESDLAISVSDNGCGIPPSEIKLIFEPFYTNKPLGQGTGLGLFISKNIVMDHGGDIIVESQPGVGTTMTVVLPLEGPGQQEDLVPEPGERRHFG
jgi:PAS domain S-box-containing protein